MLDASTMSGIAGDGRAEAEPNNVSVAKPEGVCSATPGGDDRIPDVYVNPHLNATFDLISAAQVRTNYWQIHIIDCTSDAAKTQ
jgi:hypothetical protein